MRGTTTMKIRNVNPLGDVEFPLLGRVLEAGEEFEVDDDLGAELVKQLGNFVEVDGDDDLHTMTAAQLKARAKDQGIDLDGASRKDDVLEVVRSEEAARRSVTTYDVAEPVAFDPNTLDDPAVEPVEPAPDPVPDDGNPGTPAELGDVDSDVVDDTEKGDPR